MDESDSLGTSSVDAANTADDFVVVGIGASAGGIAALRDFFNEVPDDSGMAYVVILHLSPDHDSKLAEVLQTVARIPVSQVLDEVAIEPNHVYVIPPNQSLSIRDSTLSLSEVIGFEERRAPVDIFFRTLAYARRDRAASVVLSGMGANGSMGMKRIKEMGGIAFAQDPDEAEFADMPLNSIATGFVDFVLPVAEIPKRLLAYSRNQSEVQVPDDVHDEIQTNEEALQEIVSHLRARTGHDFAQYKRATMLRRIERRINVRGLPDLQAYTRFIGTYPDEARALLRDLLISVTNFFREPDSFRKLETGIIPRLFANRKAGSEVRVWSAGCATGEEAYSLAMILAEYAAQLVDGPSVQLFATDIDETAIARARNGLYTLNDAADVSPERLRRFFVKEPDGYRVRRELREMVLFADHNLVRDPPFSHLDLVVCRNFLIYLTKTAQNRVMDVLHFALNPGGYLFLGASESIDGASDRFASVDKEHRFFQSRATSAPISLPLPVPGSKGRVDDTRRIPRSSDHEVRERATSLELHRRMLELYGPPSVLVDEEYDILHVSERAGRYLHIAAGELTRNILKLVRQELRLELRTALFQAAQTRMSVEARALRVHTDDGFRSVNLIVRPGNRDNDAAVGFFLVLFDEMREGADAADADTNAPSPVEPAAHHLEEELTRVRSQLRSAAEEHELQTEELRASNEELQAINEELLSTAEELETSKEELQSVNEELTTVNQELKIKIDELSHANNDFRNLMNSTEIGTIFLDRSLRIKLSTPRAQDVFNLIPTDTGRSLLDITSKLIDEDLASDVERVLATLQTVEREVETKEGRWYEMRALPYRTAEDRIDGAVITFVDITSRKRTELSLRDRDEQLTLALRSTRAAFWSVDLQTGNSYSFGDWRELAGSPVDANGDPFAALLALVDPDERPGMETAYRAAIEGHANLDVELQINSPERGRRWMLSRARHVPGPDSAGTRLQGVLLDISESKRAEERWQTSEERLRMLIESATDFAIFTLTPDGRIDSWSAGAQRIYGYQESEIVGRSSDTLYTAEDRACGIPDAEIRAAAFDGRVEDERWHVHKDGGQFYASGVMHSILHDPSRGFVKIARDLTDQRRNTEDRERAHAELERRVEERTRKLSEAVESLWIEVTERRAAEEKARKLLRLVVTVQEQERLRISRDLHDQLGQKLTALRLKLEFLREHAVADSVITRGIDDLQWIAKTLDTDVDLLAWEMRPPALKELGLAAAIEKHVREWSAYFGKAADVSSDGLGALRLSASVETQLYRIAQEALNNVLKHAASDHAVVVLKRDGDIVVLTVEDDGVGFDPLAERSAAGQGLGNMKERAALVGGSFEIESSPGRGTKIIARVAIETEAEASQG